MSQTHNLHFYIFSALAVVALLANVYPPAAASTQAHTPEVGRYSPPPSLFASAEPSPQSAAPSQAIPIKQHRIISDYIVKVGQKPREYANTLTEIIIQESNKAGFDPMLVTAIIKHESTFNQRCVGAAGERGLMQVHPCHFRRFNRHQLFELRYNVQAGLKVLRGHVNSAGSLKGGLRGYTGGRGGRYDRTYNQLKAQETKEG